MQGDNNCVEVAVVAGTVFVRDSKDDRGATLVFSAESWRSFIAGVKADEFSPRSTPRDPDERGEGT